VRLSILCLLGGAWLVPLHFLPWVSWHSEVPAFLSVFLLAVGAMTSPFRRVRGESLKIPLPRSMLLWPALGLLVAVQWAGGLISFSGDALVLELYLALCALAWGLGYGVGPSGPEALPRQGQFLEALAWTILVGACASALIALVQVLDVWESVSWINRMPQLRRPGANLGQPNQLATLLLLGVASVLYLHQAGRLGAPTGWLLFVLLCTGVAASESRTGLLSFVLLVLWCVAGRAWAALRIPFWAMAFGVMLFLALYLSWPLLMASAGSFAQDAKVNTSPSLRLVVWPQLFEAILMRPWLGWGLREVSEAHNAVAHAYEVSEPFTYAHNILLDLAVGIGLPLTGLFVLMTITWLWRRVQATRQLPSWYCVAAVLPVAVHSMLEFPFAYAYFLAPAMFLLGQLEALTGDRAIWRIDARIATAAMGLVAAVACWSVVEYLQIEEDFRVARFEALRVGQTPPDHQRPKVHLLTQLGALLEGARITPETGMQPEQMELARKVALRYPWPATQNRYALSLALNDNAEEALRQLQVIRAMHGEKIYAEIRLNWQALGKEKYPQLRELKLP
jgi:O-antigen ligase